MIFYSRRRRRTIKALLWIFVILISIRIIQFTFNNNKNNTTFIEFFLAPFSVTTNRADKHDFIRQEKIFAFENENAIDIARQLKEDYEKGMMKMENGKWNLKLIDSPEREPRRATNKNKDRTVRKIDKKISQLSAKRFHEKLVQVDVNPTRSKESTSSPHHSETSSKPWLQQKCKVPDLDPFNPEIAAFMDFTMVGKDCIIRQKARVRDGKLLLSLTKAQKAGYQYIRRVDDDSIELSPYYSLLELFFTPQDIGKHICLEVFTPKSSMLTGFVKLQEYDGRSNQAVDLATSDSIKECTKNRQFVYNKDGRLFHVMSNRCIVTRDSGKQIYLVFSNKPEECGSKTSRFTMRRDGSIQHFKTKTCVTSQDIIGLFSVFFLGPCSNASSFYVHGSHRKPSDLTVAIPLEEDFVQLEYIEKGQPKTEFHMYPVKRDKIVEDKEKRFRVSRDENKLNILMLMVDSLSRASVQRYMNETYAMLDKDPNTVIMKGQTINGDGTTAQILAILMGRLERELPEARRGFENSTYVDAWPSIVREYEELGYHTLHSEDYPAMNVFTYRLKGYKRKPAMKYLRPWWMGANKIFEMANQHSEKCQHMFTLDYLKNYFKEFRDEKKFMFTCTNMAHNNPKNAVILDADMKSFYEHLRGNGHLENTIVIFFADHGDRTSSFRAFMQGKLEERLPFVSLTFPSWFHRKFPREMKNIKKNSHVLTTHYDMHATLKHLQNFPNGIYKHKYGHSYFTDIARLNRTCSDAGIDSHWCPCLSYKKIDVLSNLAQKIATAVIRNMNEKLKQHAQVHNSCAELRLDTIKTANQKSTNKDVEDFYETIENEECDECGIKRNKTLNFKTKMYEITFTVLPSNGIFEATVMRDIKKNKMIVGEISRLNRYGDQPSCIADAYPYMRKFCYCKQLL